MSEADSLATTADPLVNTQLALIYGEPFYEVPQDLYIPPDALEVILEAFEGPLDLLLYLIRKQNIDVLDIPIAKITAQYMDYVELMSAMRLDLAGEYLVMAAMLAEIKSRMLLPRPAQEDGEEGDPRAELIRRLQEYERFKQAAQSMDQLPRLQRDYFVPQVEMPEYAQTRPQPEVDLQEVLQAFQSVLTRADMFSSHTIEREALSVRERMSSILEHLQDSEAEFVGFASIFDVNEGRMGVVVSFIALLELIKLSLLEFVQHEAYAGIYLRAKGATQ